jgi:hypothetical protein
MNMELRKGGNFLAPRCFQWVKKEDRGKSGTHEKKRREVGFVPPRTAEWREARFGLRGSTALQGAVSESKAHQRI